MPAPSWTTIVTANDLRQALGQHAERIVVLDVRHALTDANAGRKAYNEGHLPGAVFAHVDHDLSAPIGPTTGRHPLPDPDAFCAALGRWGIDADKQVVAYDDVGGAWAARAWWLLKHYGHDRVALLDGGLPAWTETGGALSTHTPRPQPTRFEGAPGHMATVRADDILEGRVGLLLDARAPERYRGDVEPIDPVAGHVPGAVNAPFTQNNAANGRFRSRDELRRRFTRLLGDTRPADVATYCGSGVTAPHNILAMHIADLAGAKLYPGSWSEWIRDPGRPVERGAPAPARQTP